LTGDGDDLNLTCIILGFIWYVLYLNTASEGYAIYAIFARASKTLDDYVDERTDGNDIYGWRRTIAR